MPGWLRKVLVDRGIESLQTHQATTANLTREGVHCVVATGTASGKSLGYLLPVFAELSATPTATALHLSPTKMLGADQLDTTRTAAPMSLSLLISPYDGDTPQGVRRAIHDHARWVFTNPDILHASVLDNHVRRTRVLHNLRYIVVDECHAHQGVFGANVAQILRRLLRLSRGYGVLSTMISVSATTNNPTDQTRRFIGEPVRTVTEDGAPVGERAIALWKPSLLPGLQGRDDAPVRRPTSAKTTDIMADLPVESAHILTFARSRSSAEKVALSVRERLEKRRRNDITGRIESYRTSYLAEERHDIEHIFDDGTPLGIATTDTLELGADVGGPDTTMQAGFPDMMASFWQQADRADRCGQGVLVVLVARDDPIDTYLVHSPSALLDRLMEGTIFDSHDPHVV